MRARLLCAFRVASANPLRRPQRERDPARRPSGCAGRRPAGSSLFVASPQAPPSSLLVPVICMVYAFVVVYYYLLSYFVICMVYAAAHKALSLWTDVLN